MLLQYNLTRSVICDSSSGAMLSHIDTLPNILSEDEDDGQGSAGSCFAKGG